MLSAIYETVGKLALNVKHEGCKLDFFSQEKLWRSFLVKFALCVGVVHYRILMKKYPGILYIQPSRNTLNMSSSLIKVMFFMP